MPPLLLPHASIDFTTPMLAASSFGTPPKTTCFESNHEVTTVVMKNCEPFVLGPALAMERRKGRLWVNLKFSSANLSP